MSVVRGSSICRERGSYVGERHISPRKGITQASDRVETAWSLLRHEVIICSSCSHEMSATMCMMFGVHDTAKFRTQSWCCEELSDEGFLQSSGSRPVVEENIALRKAMRDEGLLCQYLDLDTWL